MQELPIYLYGNNIDITLDLDSTVRGVNAVMYQRDLKIQKSLKNDVRIQFKNSDQKKIRIYSTQTFVFSMYDAVNQRSILQKNLTVLDVGTTSTKGLALLSLSESDTLDLDRTSYSYSIKVLDAYGDFVPAYSNTYYGVNGTLHLENRTEPVLRDSVNVNTFTKSFNADINLYEHKSGNIYANPEYNSNTALHTAAVYLDGYRGTFSVEGTLDNSPGASGNYTTITSKTYAAFTGTDFVNFNGNYTYVRFVHTPAQRAGEVDNDNPSYYGIFDKVLYRS
ncbi:MAG: hypothetical protein EBU90_11480 [Proteobacteria bacterium]|nr:hypothetical protein [Pseudomonadota bacterium]NBP14600.1 hypothetical protein [bacterium]